MILTIEDLQYIIDNLSVKPVCIVTAGSWILPFITNPADNDYIFYFDTTNLESLKGEITRLRDELRIKNPAYRTVCFMVRNIYTSKQFLHCLNYQAEDFITPWTYLEHYQTVLYGTWDNNSDLLGKDREQYKKSLKKAYEIIKEQCSESFMIKYYYYIFVGYCILQNNSFDNFTAEQIKNIRALHNTSNIWLYKEALSKLKLMMQNIDNL